MTHYGISPLMRIHREVAGYLSNVDLSPPKNPIFYFDIMEESIGAREWDNFENDKS